eukprot:7151426-Prymnesium_polylepis.1
MLSAASVHAVARRPKNIYNDLAAPGINSLPDDEANLKLPACSLQWRRFSELPGTGAFWTAQLPEDMQSATGVNLVPSAEYTTNDGGYPFFPDLRINRTAQRACSCRQRVARSRSASVRT